MAQFPVPPNTDGDTHEEGGVSWVFDGDKWVKQKPSLTTADVALFDPTNPADVVVTPLAIPEVPIDTTTQFDVNKWFVSALQTLDGNSDVSFFAFYRVVHPDDFTGETGTVGVKTDAYNAPDTDQFVSPNIVEFDFASVDLVGKGFPQTEFNMDENLLFDFITADPKPGQMNSIPNGTFEVTSRMGYRKYVGNIHMGAFWSLAEGDIIAIRTPSVWETYRMLQTTKTLSETVSDGLEVQAAISQRVSDGEDKQETLEGALETTLQTLGTLEDTVDDTLLTQNNIKTEIETLENKVIALEGTVLDATYILSSRPTPRTGEFQIYSNGSQTATWADVNSISLHNTDSNNNPHTFDSVQLDDLIRIASVGGAAVFKATSTRNVDGDNYTFEVEVVSESGVPAESLQYDFEVTPAFDASAYVTKSYVDAQDELKYDKTGGDITGTVRINCETNSDDSLRFYMKDKEGNTNISLFPSGLMESHNVVRVRKDSGDGFQIKDSTGSTVIWKATAAGETQTQKITLSGGNSPVETERVIDVKSGVAGRLAYNNKTRFSWGVNTVWIGTNGALGEDVEEIALSLQGNEIKNVGNLSILAGDESKGNHRIFTINGTLADGTDDSSDFFYAYSNVGAADAINYKGKIENSQNIVNKGYVDDKFATVNVDTSSLMPKSGDNFTGIVGFNRTDNNAQVNFKKSGSNDIQYKNSWIISFQGDSSPLVKLNTYVHMNNKKITNLANPTNDQDAVNKRSLKGARVTATTSGDTQNGGFYQSGGRLFYKLQ